MTQEGFRAVTYAKQITLEEYDSQSRTYTNEQLEELANLIRRDGQLAQNCIQFKNKLQGTIKRDAVLKSLLSFSVAVLLWRILQVRIDEQFEAFLQTHNNYSLCAAKENTPLMESLTLPPILALIGSLIWFAWILKMRLKTLQIRQLTNSFKQTLRVVLDYVLPISVLLFFGLVIQSVITTWVASQESCDAIKQNTEGLTEPIGKIATDLPFLLEIYYGVISLILKASSLLHQELQPQITIFVSIVTFLYILKELISTILTLGRRFNFPNLIEVVGWLATGIALSNNSIEIPSEFSHIRKGEWFIFSLYLSRALAILFHTTYILSQRPTVLESIEEPEELEEEELETTQETYKDL